jgi:rubrerythrin
MSEALAKPSEMVERVKAGLSDALRIAECDHRMALPFAEKPGRAVWICSACGGRFNRDPSPLSSTGERG